MVERWDVQRDGVLTEGALRKKLEARGYRVSRYVYPPGTSFPEHTHGIDKIDAVVSGKFKEIQTTVPRVVENSCLPFSKFCAKVLAD